MQFQFVGRCSSSSDRPSRSMRNGEVAYFRLGAVFAGRMFVGQAALYSDPNAAPEMFENVDFMEISDFEIVAFANPDDLREQSVTPLWETLSGLHVGDQVIINGSFHFELPRQVAPGQTPRKVWSTRADELIITAEAPKPRRPDLLKVKK